jgi:hypothetical protein
MAWSRLHSTTALCIGVSLLVAWGCLPPTMGMQVSELDQDNDGWFAGEGPGWDCDDRQASVFPGHSEVCIDGLDNDCDGRPDGDALPWLDPLIDLENWSIVQGSLHQISLREEGLQAVAPPVVLTHASAAQCWSSYRLTVRWLFERDQDFELVLGAFTGVDWDAERGTPLNGYLLTWTRSGEDTARIVHHRYLDGVQTLLNEATWQPEYDDYSSTPLVQLEVRALEHYTEVLYRIGRRDVLVTRDRFEERLGSGGVALKLGHGTQGATIQEVLVEPY